MNLARQTVRRQAFLPRRFQVFTERHIENIPHLKKLGSGQRFAMQVVASVLPFRVNEYVLNELID